MDKSWFYGVRFRMSSRNNHVVIVILLLILELRIWPIILVQAAML